MKNQDIKFTKLGNGFEARDKNGNFIFWVAGSKRSAEKEAKKLGH